MGKRALPIAAYVAVAAEYKRGATTLALAAQYGVSEGTIRTALAARGCKTRSRSERSLAMHRAAGHKMTADKDDWFRIAPVEWKDLRGRLSDGELAVYLNTALAEYPIPYPALTETTARKAFADLVAAPFERLFGAGPIRLLRSPTAQQPDYHLALKPPGNAASNQIFCVQRWATPRADAPSVEQKWNDPALRLQVCRNLLKAADVYQISATVVRRALCVSGETPSQFKPAAARALYDLVGAADVLDFSAGWGDRLVGFCAAAGTRRYVGIDPNSRLQPLYEEAANRYSGEKSVEVRCEPFEESELEPESFDMAFTSPPYFGAERYASGSACARSQSWARYATPEAWRAGFLAQAVHRAWKALRPGGVLAVNLADTQAKGRRLPLCDWLQQEVAAQRGAIALPTVALRLQGGSFNEANRTSISGEPVWMWSKGPLARPLRLVHRSIEIESALSS